MPKNKKMKVPKGYHAVLCRVDVIENCSPPNTFSPYAGVIRADQIIHIPPESAIEKCAREFADTVENEKRRFDALYKKKTKWMNERRLWFMAQERCGGASAKLAAAVRASPRKQGRK